MLKPEKSKQSSNESGNDRVTGLCYCTGHDSCNDMTEVEILDECKLQSPELQLSYSIFRVSGLFILII